jgi:hypothetical protein
MEACSAARSSSSRSSQSVVCDLKRHHGSLRQIGGLIEHQPAVLHERLDSLMAEEGSLAELRAAGDTERVARAGLGAAVVSISASRERRLPRRLHARRLRSRHAPGPGVRQAADDGHGHDRATRAGRLTEGGIAGRLLSRGFGPPAVTQRTRSAQPRPPQFYKHRLRPALRARIPRAGRHAGCPDLT